ncbi:MAG: DUF1223 domain-containing protein [Hyphomicrobiales bacterium]|nr:DUF1223 domain-containing protein [Hyphomicrobiales bacterium]
MSRNTLTAFGLAAALALSMTAASAAELPRAVVELFTSQGCSDCPPADEHLGELAEDPSLVTLSYPVRLWDYLGWRDTLATEINTERQWGYAHGRGERSVYTPQMVINGRAHAIGGQRAAVAAEIGRQANGGEAPSVPIDIAAGDNSLSISVAAGTPPAGEVTVWFVTYQRKVSVKIARGENRGKTITYYHVVRSIQPIGMWKGDAFSTSLPKAEMMKDGVDGCVVLLQRMDNGLPGAILGAAVAGDISG